MLELENPTYFDAKARPGPRQGLEPVVVVVVKGTYDIGPAGSRSWPPSPSPSRWRTCTRASRGVQHPLRVRPGDLQAGDGHGPRGPSPRPGPPARRELDVEFLVGPVNKVVRVIGDRKWASQGSGGPSPVPHRALHGHATWSMSGPLVAWIRPTPTRPSMAGKSGTRRHGLSGQPRGGRGAASAQPRIARPRRLKAGRTSPLPRALGSSAGTGCPAGPIAGTYDAKWEEERAPAASARFRLPLLPCRSSGSGGHAAPGRQRAGRGRQRLPRGAAGVRPAGTRHHRRGRFSRVRMSRGSRNACWTPWSSWPSRRS